MKFYGSLPIDPTEPGPTPPAERLRQLAELTAFACRSMEVVIALQAMAAEKYEEARSFMLSYRANPRQYPRKGPQLYRYAADAQRDAARLSALVRQALGIEEPRS